MIYFLLLFFYFSTFCICLLSLVLLFGIFVDVFLVVEKYGILAHLYSYFLYFQYMLLKL